MGENRFGAPSAALLLDGINAPDKGVRIADTILNVGQPTWTITIWFRSNDSSKIAQTLINTVPHTGIGIGYNYDGSQKLHYLIGNGVGWSGAPNHLHYSTSSVAMGIWASVALVKTGNEVQLYFNGDLEGKTIYDTSEWDHALSFYIGSVGTTPPSYEVFSGELDDLRIYDRALSGTEIRSLYNYESTLLEIRSAIATAQVVNGFVVGINVIDGGYGYTNAPSVTISGGGGTGATAIATVMDGVITAITVLDPGSGYISVPKVAVEPPPFSPKLSVEVSRVKVLMTVVPGAEYQLESSLNLEAWNPVGSPFTADAPEVVQELEVNAFGRYFRISQVP